MLVFLVVCTLHLDSLDVVFDSLVVLEILVETFDYIDLLWALLYYHLYLKLPVFYLAESQLNSLLAKFKEILLDTFALDPKIEVGGNRSPLMLQKVFNPCEYLFLAEIELFMGDFDGVVFFDVVVDQEQVQMIWHFIILEYQYLYWLVITWIIFMDQQKHKYKAKMKGRSID